MDKQNYTLRNIKKQAIQKHFYKIKKKLKKKLSSFDLIKRKRIIKDYNTLIQAVFLFITQKLSFQRLSDIMAYKYHIVMSDTAWRKQILKIAPVFLDVAKQCLEEDIKSNIQSNTKQHYYALDATNLSVNGNKSEYIRIHTQYDIEYCCMKYAFITDNHTPESILHFPIEKGAVYFADRVYGKAKQLQHIINSNADFVIRVSPFHIKLFKDSQCKEKLNLYENISGEKFSLKCFFKNKDKIFPVRIIGTKKPLEKQKISEKKVKRKAQKNQYKASEKSIKFSKWFIVATSLNDTVSDDEIVASYRIRWQIELFFKRMKTLLNFHTIRCSSILYYKSITCLWLSVGFILCAFQIYLTYSLHFSISNFNIFSLMKCFFS